MSLSCRGLIIKNISELSKLSCRYHSASSFSKIAPFKLEIVNQLPFVGIIHEAISDNEIGFFKTKAKQNLFRAQIIAKNSTGIESSIRVAKLSFLFESYDATKTLKKVHDRVGDMFGLNMKSGELGLINQIKNQSKFTAESWQVQNYGIAGHYLLHHDFADAGMDFGMTTGNRIASALFYVKFVKFRFLLNLKKYFL